MKRRKECFAVVAVISGLLCTWIAGGCTRQTEGLVPISGMEEEETGREEEIPVDYPFHEGMEGYSLSLVADQTMPDAYEVKLCDETGSVVQQFSCGQVEEPMAFCDALVLRMYEDLEIFSGTEGRGERTGQLFAWDWENRCFTETAIEIPWYKGENTDEEVAWIGNGFLVCRETETGEENRICQIDIDAKRTQELRRWTFDREENRLTIWDCLEGETVFSGEVTTDREGELEDAVYYQTLFQEQLPVISNGGAEQSDIDTWIARQESEDREADGEQSGFEYVQEHVFGNKGSTETYESRLELLADFGFADDVPFYELRDRFGNLRLELYLDEQSGFGCGLRYMNYFTLDGRKTEKLYGFAFDSIQDSVWEETDIYKPESVYGGTGADSASDFEEEWEYRGDGKPAYYRSSGIVDWLKDGGDPDAPMDILKFDYIYREDGTLYQRKYWHNSFIFGTTSCSLSSYYDETERLIYENGYITHGDYEYYYIYEDDDRKPVYALMLDNNLNYCIPVLMRYEQGL